MDKKISSKSFFEFINLVCAREVEYFMLESNYTTKFNNNIKQIIEELKTIGKISVEFMVLFNTKGEIALINEEIIGSYVGEILIENLKTTYKHTDIDTLIGLSEKYSYEEKQTFIINIYEDLCRILNEIYKDIKYRKEVAESYKNRYSLANVREDMLPMSIATILILEDICAYLSFDVELTKIIPQKTK
ncbi:hypothetical protein [Clostridium sp. UBA1652]|uniref:hypothetical protein n=1 Tax=Clostridium sp. UBA1652 TaxID=1946348 RepID=UPI00257D461F|nr:hypothetical protein [Clostridium sp. UBA1652]